MNHEFPEIKVVPIKDLVFHEIEEPLRTKRLEERLMSDGFLKNPVIVGRIPNSDSKLLLLDGMHRVSALRNLGCDSVVAQFVDYFDNEVKVDAWCHLIQNCDRQDLLSKISGIRNVRLTKTSTKRARELLKQRRILCYLLFKNLDTFTVKGISDLKAAVSELSKIIGICHESSSVRRGSEAETRFLLMRQKMASAALMIPVFKKKEIVEFAIEKKKLPTGITRHIVPSRVLGLRVDLGLLKVEMPIEGRNSIIQEMFSLRMANGKVRYYGESVLIFDD
jgi:hypothetical protein